MEDQVELPDWPTLANPVYLASFFFLSFLHSDTVFVMFLQLGLPSSLLTLAVHFCSLSWISRDYSKPLLNRKQRMLKIERFLFLHLHISGTISSVISDWKQLGETRPLIFAQPASPICTYRRGLSSVYSNFLVAASSLREI